MTEWLAKKRVRGKKFACKQTWNEKYSRIVVNILYLQPKKIRKKVDHNCRLRKIYMFNNYSPKAKLILLNNPQDEVEGIIHKLYHPVPIPFPSKVTWSVPI